MGSKEGCCRGMAYKSDAIHVGWSDNSNANGEKSKEFEVKVGMHEGSVLSPLLFADIS